ncbi:MAG: crosslink repair DNA glycosylase YcaQ family protein [Deinococcota bacterium]
MPLTLSLADARQLLARHHFEQTDSKGVFERLGSIQFDPLNPVGRNHDLVLQARVADYKVDDWQRLAYEDRYLLDAWDKQASLVRMRDWAVRRVYHQWHAKSWQTKVLEPYVEAVETVRTELTERGPLSSNQFEFQPHRAEWEGSWHGPKLTKNILRGLWHTGQVVTHSRNKGHHVYDLTENVVPTELLAAPAVSERDSTAWLILLRHHAVGLLRPNPSAEVWSLYLPAPERRKILAELVSEGKLLEVDVKGMRFHVLLEVLAKLEHPPLPPRMVFVAPLDPIIWDRKAALHLFNFDYLWEVYKPAAKRAWGYYVLPVFYGDRFVARFDSRFKDRIWELYRWYWEDDITPDVEMLAALETSVKQFMTYLGASKLKLPRGMDKKTRAAWQAGGKR